MIPFYGLDRQYSTLKDELLDATDRVLRTGQLINGEFTNDFEFWLADKTKCRYALTVDSGTQALAMIANAMWNAWERPIFEKIRIPNLTYVATLNAFMTSGDYFVELADTDKNGIMLEDTFTPGCHVGLYGRQIPYHIDGDFDIVDGAQHWLVANGKIGKAMAISFDPTKNLPSSGNGGAIVTNDAYLYAYLSNYKNNGKSQTVSGSNYFDVHQISGTNSKMSELECAHLLVRARYLDEWQQRRKEIREYYINRFSDLPIRCLSEGTEQHCDHKFVIDTEGQRKFIQSRLYNKNITTMIHYDRTLSELPLVRYNDTCKSLDFLSVSSVLSRSVLSLPIYPELTDGEVEYIADSLCEVYAKIN